MIGCPSVGPSQPSKNWLKRKFHQVLQLVAAMPTLIVISLTLHMITNVIAEYVVETARDISLLLLLCIPVFPLKVRCAFQCLIFLFL